MNRNAKRQHHEQARKHHKQEQKQHARELARKQQSAFPKWLLALVVAAGLIFVIVVLFAA